MFSDPRPRHEAPQAPAVPGELIGGKYRVGECIGYGGMGVVCEATHVELERKLAIKFVRPELAESDEFVGRFLNEARAAAALRSEHVAQVLDCGRLPSGTPYMVLEYLEGADLESIVGKKGALPVELAVDLALQLCEALAEAHAMHIVHRDIKPQNLFVIEGPGGNPVLKVLDFGVSKRLSSEDPSVTHASQGIGSPHYMSPEQMTSPRDVDARSDIWSVGAVLFELMAARPPFTGETLPEVCAKVVTQPPPFIRSFRPNVPPRLEAVVQHCLEKDRELRFADVGELAEALAPFASSTGVASVDLIARILGRDPGRRSTGSVVVVEDDAALGRHAAHAIPGVRKTRLPMLLAAVALGGATVVAAQILLRGGVPWSGRASADSEPGMDAASMDLPNRATPMGTMPASAHSLEAARVSAVLPSRPVETRKSQPTASHAHGAVESAAQSESKTDGGKPRSSVASADPAGTARKTPRPHPARVPASVDEASATAASVAPSAKEPGDLFDRDGGSTALPILTDPPEMDTPPAPP